MIGTAYWYLHTDQWRYDSYGADALASPLGAGRVRRPAHRRLLAQSARLGWMPTMPDLRPQPARPGRRGARGQPGRPGAEHVVDEL